MPIDFAECQRCRGLPIWRTDNLTTANFKIGELSETGAADNAKHVLHPYKVPQAINYYVSIVAQTPAPMLRQNQCELRVKEIWIFRDALMAY